MERSAKASLGQRARAVAMPVMLVLLLLSPPAAAMITSLYCTSTTVTQGTEVTTHEACHASDDSWYQIDAVKVGANYRITVDMNYDASTIDETTVTQIYVFSEAHVDGANPVDFQIWNYDTLVYDPCFSVSATSDSTYSHTITTSCDQYIENTTGAMMLQVSYSVKNITQSLYQDWTYIELTYSVPPGKPVLVSPENNYQTSDNTPTFTWENGANATYHRLVIDNSSDFSDGDNIYDNANIYDNTCTIENELPPDNYWWKVAAGNASGENWSENTWRIEIIPYVPPEWQLIETWTGTVSAPVAWQIIETWTGTVNAPAEWQLIESWTGTVSAPAQWQLIETWTGTVSAPAAWQLVETWTGTVSAPIEWNLIETWTGTVSAPAQWQAVETWTGTVSAPAQWSLIETWTGTVSAPAAWQLIETWTGTVEAPVEWQLIETWTGTVQAPVEWQVIETWTGTVSAPAAWSLIETWTGTVTAPAAWQLIETWTGTVSAPAEWQLVEMWTGTVSAPVQWQLIETWTGTVSAPAEWQLVETWTGTVSAPAQWQFIETWTGTVTAPAVWQLIETWTGTVSAPAAWSLIETWTGAVTAPAEWQLVETWTGTVTAPAEWQLIETWTGTVSALAQWQLIETWTGTVSAPAAWQLVETWTGTVSAPAQWSLIETWTGTVSAPAAWQLIETWTGTVSAPVPAWQVIETWTGTVSAPVAWQLIETWTGTVAAPLPAWYLIETWTGTVQAPVLPAPTLVLPADGTTTTDNTPMFRWDNTYVTDNYEFWVDNDTDFSSPAIFENTTDNFYEVAEPGLADGTYYWRVRAYKGENISGFSSAWTLTISVLVPDFSISVSPTSGSVQQGGGTVAIVTITSINNYSLTVSLTASGQPSDVAIIFTPQSGTPTFWSTMTINVGSNAPTGDCTITITGTGADNKVHTGTYTLTITAVAPPPPPPPPPVDNVPPPVPSLISPTDGENIIDNTPLLDWSDVSDPSGVIYDLSVARDAGFASLALQKTGLSASTYELTPAEALANGTYYWRVRGVDGVGNIGSWSEKWSFMIYVPPAPATLTADTTPIKASVYVDNVLWGIAPQTRSLVTGSYTVSFGDYLGYLTPPPQTVTLTAGETRTITGIYTKIPPELIENESSPIDIPFITTDENATIEVENTAITGMTIDVGENVENVRITVQQLTDKPTEIAIGAPGVTYCYLNIVSENIIDADIDIVLINFRVEKAWITTENMDPDSIVIRRWDLVAEVWVPLPTARIGEDGTHHYYRAESPGLSIFGITGLAPTPAEFELSNLVIDPSEVGPGETVTISIVVTNIGELEGTCTVMLKIDNVVEATEDVTLAGGATETVTFSVSRDIEGTYNVEVDGLTGTFVVTAQPAPPSMVPLAITVTGIALLAGILIWLRKGRI